MKIITSNQNDIKINSYILQKNGYAIVIDPYDFSQIQKALNGQKLEYIFLTHEHFDHIHAVDSLRKTYNAKVISHIHASQNISNCSKNLSKFSSIVFNSLQIKPKSAIEAFSIKPSDITFDKNFTFFWQECEFSFYHAPGHSEGGACIIYKKNLFVGDNLFEFCDTNTKGYGANKKDYENITLKFLYSLKSDFSVFAGHYGSFKLYDKLHAKQKAIELFKKRFRYTNSFVDFNGFIDLLENHHFFVREKCVFVLKKDNDFLRFYYFVDTLENLKNLDDFFKFFKTNIVFEIVSKKQIEYKIYENLGFSFYKSYSRYRLENKKNVPISDKIQLAKNNDISQIQAMINSTFDPLSDYIPTIKELENFIENKQIKLVKIKNDIAGVAIFQELEHNHYLRLFCVKKEFQNQSIGKILATNFHKHSIYTSWIDDENDASIHIHKNNDYQNEGLKNFIFVKLVGGGG